ncbi:hypothetical protein OTK49_03260 [Vibrio coralliirubri]|uniref:hypothetical protein n=1 Tax=Vibrio coralliirubri TaxID=1516159 RepID=UPI0022850566|nr:hypothetical protein [Vibrio coralliirubri]MCY9861535.1 hypothetical protein [Vibrio coralliirubri]
MASPTRRPSLTTDSITIILNEMELEELTQTFHDYTERLQPKIEEKYQPAISIHEHVAYHGSDTTISDIDFEMSEHFGFHIGSKSQAKMFGDKLHEVTFRYSNLLRLDDLGTWSAHSIIQSLKALGHMDTATATPIYDEPNAAHQDKMLRSAIVNAGFDAIVYNNQVEQKNTDSYIIIDKKCVTSIRCTSMRRPSIRA